MCAKEIYIGKSRLVNNQKEVSGKLVTFENEDYYKISNYDGMRPFFMSIVSDSNHWMFISSNGGLSAGRKNSESALFPYYTDDKITESADITGSKTIIQIHAEEGIQLWEPFSSRYTGLYNIQRNLYKNTLGNKIVFEEINEDLKLTFRYHWNSSSEYGFVRKASLHNSNERNVITTVLDGIQNLMPDGVASAIQNASSNLVDAYKRNELVEDLGLGIYTLSAIIVDKAEPSEALKSTTVWSTGIAGKYLVSSLQLDAFRNGHDIIQETDIKAEKGAYFVCADVALKPKTSKEWMMVAEVNQSKIAIAQISNNLKENAALSNVIAANIKKGSHRLFELNCAADGLQLTADTRRNTRHFSNVLFNIMRGGIFDDNYQVELADFKAYLHRANTTVYKEVKAILESFSQQLSVKELKERTESIPNPDFRRLLLEYLPLKFSRRHGDPSRPWNKFSINTETEDGEKVLDYEGNWRDIFQNWEALAHSYPAFIDSMIHKFLNASTFDGYNPYRVTKDGFDWETIEPDDPWSYIGYWGDHQIIYLLKFLEFIENHYPQKLEAYFQEDIFVYANVPYKIKEYSAILANPKDTIIFDETLDAQIRSIREQKGADGALIHAKDDIYRVNLLEKLLATVLAKVSNFIPEGGIWMNTQRPEWNDANNALVGNGVSMVTLYYLRRFLKFFEGLVENMSDDSYAVSMELLECFNTIRAVLIKQQHVLKGKISDTDRKTVMDGLGTAGSTYREKVYASGFSTKKSSLTKADLAQFITTSLRYLEHSINANQREDKMYHAYNLMTVTSNTEVSISYLSEMLEGQVAALSAGYISGKAALELLDGLKNSALFRHDQYSYILYPNKDLPRFVEKNNIPPARIQASTLVERLLDDGISKIVERDTSGEYHFNGSFNNADSLKAALATLPEEYGTLVEKDRSMLLDIFEEVFDHKSFTGRSGTFFGYEGLGSIYWHMVSKLQLAVQETCLRALKEEESEEVIGRLLEHYYEINEGIGVHKSPKRYGAIPTDPYSHTPAGKGAQQPGMTGQVKEDILSRFGELGVFVENGCLSFNPSLLRKEEFLTSPATFTYTNINREVRSFDLEAGSLCFTYCQVPIIFKMGTSKKVEVMLKGNGTKLFDNTLQMDKETSSLLFDRIGEIEKIIVSIP